MAARLDRLPGLNQTISPAALVFVACAALVLAPHAAAEASSRGRPWTMHTIDDSSRGADGVRLADVNGDGLPDIATGWEEGGLTRLYLHPGHAQAAKPWPAVRVGRTPSVEDAVSADLDGDGDHEVISCCEGGARKIVVHWPPDEVDALLQPKRWRAEPLPESIDRMMWMFAVPAQLDGRRGVDLAAAGKGSDCRVGWFAAPTDPRRLHDWAWHDLAPAGWIMSLRVLDVDGDGDPDLLFSDRKGPHRGVRWLENPGRDDAVNARSWKDHCIGAADCEGMFLDVADLDADGRDDVALATRRTGLLLLLRPDDPRKTWTTRTIPWPADCGTGKGVAAGDLDGDGALDLVLSCEHARSPLSGLVWLDCQGPPAARRFTVRELSGPRGIKFDRIELADLDGDGDLDALTCEESHPVEGRRHGLGVVWYENPARDGK